MLDANEQAHRWGLLPNKPLLALALDIGTQKIGVATGQSLLGKATPQTTIKANNASPNWEQLEQQLKRWQPDVVVIGWPLNMDDTPTFLTEHCQRIANKIHGRYGLCVRCVDERLSTREAYEIALSDPDNHWKNKVVDALAAAVILETWFNQTT